MYEELDQHQKLNTSAALLLLLCFSLHKSCRRHTSSLQQAEWNPCGVGRRPWMAGERRRARDGPSARSPREQGWNEGTRSAAQGRMWERAVLPTFPKQKSRTPYRRKGPAAAPNRMDQPPAPNRSDGVRPGSSAVPAGLIAGKTGSHEVASTHEFATAT